MTVTRPASRFFRSLLHLYRDADYFRSLLKFGIPISLQQLVMASLNMVGGVMIGQKGEAAVASVGLAGQVFFLLTLVLFGVGSGSAMFTAQLWGRKDIPNLRKVLSLCLGLSLAAGLVFLLLSEILPAQILGIYSKDPAVIALGSDYLRIFAWAFLFFAVTSTYSSILRSTGEVRLPMIVSVGALSLNMLLSYGLIFGKLGFPAMGVRGAAVAVLVARVLECVILVALVYVRRSPLAAPLRELLKFDFSFILTILKPILPVTVNEFLWAMGITAYSVVYARMGTGPLAAINMISTIENLSWGVLTGIANATAIMVGNSIGAGDEKEAFRHAGRSLGVGAATGLVVGGMALLGANSILELYKVSSQVLKDAQSVLVIFGLFLWLRAMNSIIVVGILRSGGDTLFSLFIDGMIIWVVGVPLTFLGAFVLHMPVYLVYLLAMSEEVTKWLVGLPRFFSKRWIHNLAQSVNAE